MSEKNNTTTSPVKNEVDGVEQVTFTVEVKGQKVSITTPVNMEDGPLEAAELFEQGKELSGFMLLINPEAAAQIRKLRVTVRDFSEKIVPAWNEATGLGE